MNYDEEIRHPGDKVSSGADIFKVFGYTDVQNPIYSFDLMNDSNFKYLKDCIDNKSEIPEIYNANIIRLRDYRLGSMINDFRDLCDSTLVPYEDSWKEYREEYNPSMPEEFYDFWMLYDSVLLKEILPKFINLIDPISMKWISPDYPKITVKDGIYQYKTDKPIMTSNHLFLLPETEIEYFFYQPTYPPISAIYERINEKIHELFPNWLCKIDYLNNELTYTEPEKGQTKEEFIRNTKWRVRRAIPG